MIPPGTAEAPPRERLVITPALIAINATVFATMIALGVSPMTPDSQSLLKFGANFGAALVLEGEYWRPFTAMFVHIGAVHLLVNMFSLWNVGGFVERLIGKPLFLVAYLLTGLAGSFASVLMRPLTISAGASGAIFGLFGVVIGFTFRARDQLPPRTLASLRSSIFATLAFNVLFALSSPNLDNAAHVGGLTVGILSGVVATASALERTSRRASWTSQLIVLATVIGLGVLAVTRTKNNPRIRWELELERAVLALEADDAALALKHVTTAIATRDEPRGRFLRGTALAALGHRAEALVDLDAAILGHDEDMNLPVVQVRHVRGTLRLLEGNYAGAIDDLRLVVKARPDEPVTRNNLAWALVHQNQNLDEALEHATVAVKADSNAAYLGTRCWVHAARGDAELARADCEAAVKLKPDDAMDQGMLALIAGDKAKALELWEKSAKDDATNARDLEPWLERARAP